MSDTEKTKQQAGQAATTPAQMQSLDANRARRTASPQASLQAGGDGSDSAPQMGHVISDWASI